MSHIVLRTSGSSQIGLGHLRRSLTLAQALSRAGARVTFLFEGERAAAQAVRECAFDLVDITADPRRAVEHMHQLRPQMAIVDARDVLEPELRAMRLAAGWLGVIDDIADRDLTADLITNSALYAEELPYRRDSDTILLLGPKYVLLREGFAVEPSRNVPSRARRVLITLGASDTHNLTPRLVEWTRAECPDVEALVVVGPFFANIAGIEAARPHAMLYDPPDICAVMLSADIAVSGGGQTTYELAATAAAVLGIQVAHDQRRNLEALSKAGALISLGEASAPDLEGRYREHLARLVVAGEERARMGRTGRALVDGYGATRVAATILESA